MTKLFGIVRNILATALLISSFISYSQEKDELQNWHLRDFTKEVRGINVQKAYTELLKDKQPQQKVVVAVIDSGIDIEHEDLQGLIWVNKDEIPGNGIDDDQNGYIDDVHGWNFLGNANGDVVGKDNLEVTRMYKKYSKEFADVKTAADLSKDRLAAWKEFQRVKNSFEEGKLKAQNQLQSYKQFKGSYDIVMGKLKDKFGDDFTAADVEAWEPEDEMAGNLKSFYMYLHENDVDAAYMEDYGNYVKTQAEWYYNDDVDARRDIIKDDPNNLYEKGYGNNTYEGPDAMHGTHVAGIIGALRNNGVGMDGIANNIEIMVIRAVPEGDEHDKDVANAIRYAVDNGARVVNMSFGKSFSPHQKLVAEAIQYSEDKGVLLVHAAGNDSLDLDVEYNFPTNYSEYIRGKVKTFITVGASSINADEEFVAEFSNYGDKSVDVFAPGVDIYSTVPDNEYEFSNGTSMAAPVVSGVAALIMSYYPDLSAKKVKKIIEKSSKDLSYSKVNLPGSGGMDDEGNEIPTEEVTFDELSRTAGLIDAYEALKLADKKSKY